MSKSQELQVYLTEKYGIGTAALILLSVELGVLFEKNSKEFDAAVVDPKVVDMTREVLCERLGYDPGEKNLVK